MSESITIKLPINLRYIWPYPNLLHFDKYIDLLLLSARQDKQPYNKTIVFVSRGRVLLKYSSLAFRWHVAYNTARSIIHVMVVSGWLKIKKLETKAISNRKIKAPFIIFPKTGYDTNSITILMTENKNVLMSVLSYNSNSYENNPQRLNNGVDDSIEDSVDDSINDGIDDSVDDSVDDSIDDSIDNVNNYPTVIYNQSSQQLDDSINDGINDSVTDIYNIEEEDDIIIKEKINKKENQRPPSQEEIEAYAMKCGISKKDSDFFYNYYTSNDWKTNTGEPVRNWKILLQHMISKKKKYDNNIKKPTATDKLARQAAELASHYAGTLSGEGK